VSEGTAEHIVKHALQRARFARGRSFDRHIRISFVLVGCDPGCERLRRRRVEQIRGGFFLLLLLAFVLLLLRRFCRSARGEARVQVSEGIRQRGCASGLRLASGAP